MEIALADVVPSLLAGLDVPGMVDVVGLPRARRVCLLLVDGLGWHLLRDHADDAPFLASLAGGPISTGFPSTTATSIASLGTGLASGEHGLVGYSFAADGVLLNALGWNQHGVTPSADLRAVVVPEELQPRQTALERAAEAGVEVRVVAPYEQRRSGLTRAVLRGGRFEGVFALGDLTTAAIAALQADRAFCYAYHADLDKLGHVHGPGSDPWRLQLTYVDRLAELIVARLPSDGLLAVTGDHGMVAIGEDDRIDFDTEPLLQAGVRMLGGEARARYLYTEPGAVDAVAETWQGVLGDRAQVMRRDDAIEAGWFGPTVADHVRPRIGDLVVAMRGTSVVVRSAAEPLLSRFAGHHGSFTAAEQLVPLLHKM